MLQGYSLAAYPLLCDRHGVHELKLATVDGGALLASHCRISHSIYLTKVDMDSVPFHRLVGLSSFRGEA